MLVCYSMKFGCYRTDKNLNLNFKIKDNSVEFIEVEIILAI